MSGARASLDRRASSVEGRQKGARIQCELRCLCLALFGHAALVHSAPSAGPRRPFSRLPRRLFTQAEDKGFLLNKYRLAWEEQRKIQELDFKSMGARWAAAAQVARVTCAVACAGAGALGQPAERAIGGGRIGAGSSVSGPGTSHAWLWECSQAIGRAVRPRGLVATDVDDGEDFDRGRHGLELAIPSEQVSLQQERSNPAHFKRCRGAFDRT